MKIFPTTLLKTARLLVEASSLVLENKSLVLERATLLSITKSNVAPLGLAFQDHLLDLLDLSPYFNDLLFYLVVLLELSLVDSLLNYLVICLRWIKKSACHDH